MERSSEKDLLIDPSDLVLSSSTTLKTYKLYAARWLILAVLVLLNVSSGIVWISFASVADEVKAYYSLNGDFLVNLLSMIFFIVSLPVGFVGAWTLDTWGLRIGLLIGAWLNGIGAVVRYFSSFGHTYAVVMVGQIVGAAAQPFILFAPTKLAALWFGEKERATANMLASISNPLGIAVASLASPRFESMDQLLWVYAIPAGAGAVLTTVVFCIWGARPPIAPSASAVEEKTSFWQGLKQFWRFKSYVLLLLSWGGGVGLFNALQTFMEQLLCTRGYSDAFAGLCGALLILCGIPGALIAGLIVDHTRRYKEVVKVCYLMASAALIWFTVVIRYQDEEILIGVAISMFGFFALAMLPVSLELGVECTYPHMSEATSAGLLLMMGQLVGIVLVFAGDIPGLVTQLDPMDAPNNTCFANSTSSTHRSSFFSPVTPTPASSHPSTVPDLINFSWTMSGLAVLVSISMTVFFWPRYQRIEHERAVSLSSERLSGTRETDNVTPVN